MLWFAAILAVGSVWPRATGATVLLLGLWAFTVIHIANAEADRQLKRLLTRAAILRHVEPATHLVHVWFARTMRNADLTVLLAIAHKARETISILPRLRAVSNARGSLTLLTSLIDQVLERSLRTDNASDRTTSWVRILTRRLFRNLIRKTGLAAAAQLLSAVLLAVPPARGEGWGEGALEESANTTPDTDEYLKTVLAALPVDASEASLVRVREQLQADGSRTGSRWFTAVASRAEKWRQQAPPAERDCRLELLGEVLWGVYEDNAGPRPMHFDLYDQLRLQLPDLIEGLSVDSLEVDESNQELALKLHGFPAAFQDLTFSAGRRQTGSDLVLQTRDERRWVFERLEAGGAQEVMVIFRRGNRAE